jgi:hypothetical protein
MAYFYFLQDSPNLQAKSKINIYIKYPAQKGSWASQTQ